MRSVISGLHPFKPSNWKDAPVGIGDVCLNIGDDPIQLHLVVHEGRHTIEFTITSFKSIGRCDGTCRDWMGPLGVVTSIPVEDAQLADEIEKLTTRREFIRQNPPISEDQIKSILEKLRRI